MRREIDEFERAVRAACIRGCADCRDGLGSSRNVHHLYGTFRAVADGRNGGSRPRRARMFGNRHNVIGTLCARIFDNSTTGAPPRNSSDGGITQPPGFVALCRSLGGNACGTHGGGRVSVIDLGFGLE